MWTSSRCAAEPDLEMIGIARGMLWNTWVLLLACVYLRASWLILFKQKAKMTDFDRYKVMKAKKMVSCFFIWLIRVAFTLESPRDGSSLYFYSRVGLWSDTKYVKALNFSCFCGYHFLFSSWSNLNPRDLCVSPPSCSWGISYLLMKSSIRDGCS